jgi:CBS-domain-containing membrane protein
MREHEIRRFPIVDERHRLVGIVAPRTSRRAALAMAGEALGV